MSTRAESRHALAFIALCCALASALLARDYGRTVPGGPFLSLSADVLPVAMCLTGAIVAVIALAIALPIAAWRVSDVLLFWFRPHARGQFLSW